jgi:hypothetical protein
MNPVLLYKPAPQSRLVGGLRVLHIENKISRPDVHFGIPVAVQAPRHRERLGLPGERHFVHTAVATGAADALVNVNTMIEIDKVRQVVNPGPLNGFAGSVTLPHGLQRRRHCPHFRMAIHACLSGRYTGEFRCLHRVMAIPAVNSKASGVMFMTERHGLLAGDVLAGFVRRSHDHRSRPYRECGCGCGGEENKPENRVRTRVEVTWHPSGRTCIS